MASGRVYEFQFSRRIDLANGLDIWAARTEIRRPDPETESEQREKSKDGR
jgi:hypothetical protein